MRARVLGWTVAVCCLAAALAFACGNTLSEDTPVDGGTPDAPSVAQDSAAKDAGGIDAERWFEVSGDGTSQTYEVPAGCKRIHVMMWAGGGGTPPASDPSSQGAPAGFAIADWDWVQDVPVEVIVGARGGADGKPGAPSGGQGGFPSPDGDAGGNDGVRGGGGGGASSVRNGPFLALTGGGGGAGNCFNAAGGKGGGDAGLQGSNEGPLGGQGGSASEPGAGGQGFPAGQSGSDDTGGAGANADFPGGGGGGGYFGGGGGAGGTDQMKCGGGGGGSGFIGFLSDAGARTFNGAFHGNGGPNPQKAGAPDHDGRVLVWCTP